MFVRPRSPAVDKLPRTRRQLAAVIEETVVVRRHAPKATDPRRSIDRLPTLHRQVVHLGPPLATVCATSPYPRLTPGYRRKSPSFFYHYYLKKNK
jgi:hypothetical protein